MTIKMMRFFLISILAMTSLPTTTTAFTATSFHHHHRIRRPSSFGGSETLVALGAETSPNTAATAATAATTTETLSLSLTKPLGLVLEEVEEGQACGVFVAGLAETGSALAHADQVQGATLLAVDGVNVATLDFDAVMDTIISSNAPSGLVDLEFGLVSAQAAAADEDDEDAPPSFAVGTPVTIQVLQSGSDSTIHVEAKVGDNLRQVLQQAGVPVYEGLKQQLGNCGGAGQCTFCAMDIIESEGWAERSEYEDSKLSKLSSTARLACLNSIQGPATIRKTQR